MSTGILLMTYGSATTSDGVRSYLESVYAGRAVPEDLIHEFERRYDVVGRSPLVDITRRQGAALQQQLDAQDGPARYRVAVGMLHSEPKIQGAVQGLAAAGVDSIIAIVLAPQFSPIILAGYQRALDAASTRLEHRVAIHLAGAWYDEPAFIASLAQRLRTGLDRFGANRHRVPVIFTAHSVPLSVIQKDPGYITQLTDTAAAVADAVSLPRSRWQFAYQSAGHSPEPWLTPDLLDVLPVLKKAGHTDALIAPLQFCADHLEVLYDLDVAAREQAEAAGIAYHRMEMPNVSPAFIAALADVVARESAPVG
ncbi:MAG TPA: ferrochelatase [Candidatus Dormibacteraeota bacterium]|jgi:ferrochelatase